MKIELKTEKYLKELKHHINLLLKIKLNNNSKDLKFIYNRINQMIEEVRK